MRTKDFMQPRFSIRKLTIGAVSVMFGAVIFGVSATQVKAAVQPEQPQTEQVQTEQKQSEQAQPTQTDAAKAVTATAADQDTAAKTETVVKKVVATEPTQGQTTEKDASHVTGLPADGKVKADLSISAKDKDGKTEEVSAAAKDNQDKIVDGKTVAVDSKNAQDVEAHLTIKNTGNQDETIGVGGAFAVGHDLRLKLSSSNGLVPDSQKAVSIDVTDGDGKQVANSGLNVWYYYKPAGGSGQKVTYNDWRTLPDAGKYTAMIGINGTLKAGYTAKVNVPLVKESNNKTQISLADGFFGDYSKLTVETKEDKGDPLWNVNDLKGAEVILATRQGDDYVEISKEDSDAIKQDNFPDISDVVKVTDSGDVFDQSGQNLYKDGYYIINLQDIQKVLQKHGYTVNPNTNLDGVMDHYTYNSFSNSTALNIIRNGQAHEGTNTGKPVFYIEVHKVLDTKDTEFEEGSTEAKNFNPSDLVNSVSDVTNWHNANYGPQFPDTPVDKGQAKTEITDAQGNPVDKIDENTKPGTYYVTVSYKMTDNMQIQNTATVTINPKTKAPDKTPGTPSDPDHKGGQTDNKGSDTTPTTPATPEAPETPDTPDSPAIDNNDKTDVETPDVPDAPEAPSTKDDTVAKTLPAATATVQKFAPAAVSVKKAGAVKAAAPSQKAALPQTGSENATGIIGILAAILGLFGLGFSKRRN